VNRLGIDELGNLCYPDIDSERKRKEAWLSHEISSRRRWTTIAIYWTTSEALLAMLDSINQQGVICSAETGNSLLPGIPRLPQRTGRQDAPCGGLGLINAVVSFGHREWIGLQQPAIRDAEDVISVKEYCYDICSYEFRVSPAIAIIGQSHDRTLYVELSDSVRKIEIQSEAQITA